jgi:hypothetical protein
MLPSSAQLVANIANAKKSTGPKTEAGKNRSRLNAYRHGITGQICIFTNEDRQAFDIHCDGIREAFEPVGALELDLAQSIAEDRWRLKRARALESGIFALGHSAEPSNASDDEAEPDPGQQQIDTALAQARTWLADGKGLQLLTLYEQRIHRSIEKNMAQIAALQTTRKAARKQALEEAELLARLAYLKGENYNPASDFPPEPEDAGFEFSTATIHRQIRRKERLREARHYRAYGWSTKFPYDDPAVRFPQAA